MLRCPVVCPPHPHSDSDRPPQPRILAMRVRAKPRRQQDSSPRFLGNSLWLPSLSPLPLSSVLAETSGPANSFLWYPSLPAGPLLGSTQLSRRREQTLFICVSLPAPGQPRSPSLQRSLWLGLQESSRLRERSVCECVCVGGVQGDLPTLPPRVRSLWLV